MDIVISIVAKLAEYTVAPIGRQLGYPFLHNKNINDLRVRRQELVDAREEVRHRVEEDKNHGREAELVVSTWLQTVDDAISELPNTSQDNYPSCFNIFQRYRGSRRAKKKEKELSELIVKKEKFNNVIGHLVPLSGIERTSNIPESYQFLGSRTSMAKEIKDALANSDLDRIGLYGMGGVGKTTLLDEVEKLALDDKLFDQVIKVTVSQSLNIEDIQAQMGDKLRLNLKDAESKQGRADLLRNKLEVGNKFLIILDDLWNELDLVGVGIPCTLKKGSKILLTSRKENVLTKNMNVQKCFRLNHLSKEESWKFFSAIVGEFDKADIEHVAKKVAKECGGLPLALVGVAKALKGEELEIWTDALTRLENPIAEKIEGVTDILYSSIKLSYDRIKSTEARLLFLLCSVFPDDYEISVKKLQMYAMGMRLLNGVNTWEATRNRVIKLVKDLVSSSLLLESEDKHVKMHDVVRDIAIHIASSKEANMSALNFGYKHSEWPENDRRGSFRAIFGLLYNFRNLPQDLQFPNLELLILSGSVVWMYKSFRACREIPQISNTLFEGIEKLTVLDLKCMWFQELRISLTHTLVENLQIFCMEECGVYDIDIIGELKMLQILRIKLCLEITHLPATMSKLTNLKVLEVSDCEYLNVIPTNILSSMTKLEELDLSSSFGSWGEEVLYENKLVKNVTLSELKNLPHLISLKLDIFDERMLEDLLFVEHLRLANFQFNVRKALFPNLKFSRSLMLKIDSEVNLIDRVFGTLWQRCEYLQIEDVANLRFKSNENGCPNLIKQNSEKDIAFFFDKVAFSELKELKMIRSRNNLKKVWQDHGLIANSFCKLETIYISEFNGLRYIFSSSVLMALVSLNSLTIFNCELVETIFKMEEQMDDAKVIPLEKLYLTLLPKLKCVWNKDPSGFFTFPNLQKIDVRICPELQSVFPASFINHVQELQKLSIKNNLRNNKGVKIGLFSEDTVFSEEVHICPELQNVFPTSFINHVQELHKLSIKNNLRNSKGVKIGLFSEDTVFSEELRYLAVHYMRDSVPYFKFAWFPRLQKLKLINYEEIALPQEMKKLLYNTVEVKIKYSTQLVQLFSNENQESNDTMERSCATLKNLSLKHLSELTHVWKDNSMKFDNLERLDVDECGKLECLVPAISMLNLRYLFVKRCDKLMNLVSSSSLAKSVVHIRVSDCEEMTCIFGGDDHEDDAEIVFSKLKHLQFKNLARLESFYPSGRCTKLVFPCLEEMSVNECPTMNTFSHRTRISTPELKKLDINGSEVANSLTNHDLNDILDDNWRSEIIMSIRYLFTSSE